MGTMIIPVGTVDVQLIDDDRICLGILAGKRFETDTLALWGDVCLKNTDATVLDVGAYSGLFSIAAAKLGCRPIAIEPLPEMQKRLMKNADLNGVTFRLIKGAACNQKGEVRIGFNDKVPYTSGASMSRKSGGHVMAKAVRLDDIECDNLKAVKIDVERHEIDVLKGAQKLLAKHKPLLVIEALIPDAVKAVKEILPNYRQVDFFDNRNMIMEPRS